MEGLQPESSGDHCRVSSDGSKIRSVYGETHSAFGRENGLDPGQTGCQETNYKAVAVSRQEMPAVLRCWEWEMMRTKSNERCIGDRE